MRYLSLLVNGEIVDQMPTTLSDDDIINLDEMLRKNGIYGEETEIAATQTDD